MKAAQLQETLEIIIRNNQCVFNNNRQRKLAHTYVIWATD